MRGARFLLLLLLPLLLAMACGGDEQAPPSRAEKPVLRMRIIAVPRLLHVVENLVQAHAQQTGVRIEILTSPTNVSDTLLQYRQELGGRSTNIDIYMIDVIWPMILAEHLADLSSELGEARRDFFPGIVDNNTIRGRLVAMPWYADVGLLYYRADLLERYGYTAPPATWAELEAMATRIQEAERAAGNMDFHGFLWPASPTEALTCLGIEWQAADGGGTILAPDATPTIDNPAAARALDRAARWIGTITPRAALGWDANAATEEYIHGSALFLRAWSHAGARIAAAGGPAAGTTRLAMIPGGPAGSAPVIGGWQLAVSAYSRHPEEARAAIRWLVSPMAQVVLARGGFVPARSAIYTDPAHAENLELAFPQIDIIRNSIERGVFRPSKPAGRLYSEVTTTYFRGAHEVLAGRATGAEAVAAMQQRLLSLR
jgi:trehalose/maltose transport system substrate-binding protein